MRVALVHDWLTGMRGGEAVLEGLLELFPDAEIFTLLHARGSVSPRIEERPVHASLLDRVPGVARWYRYALPLFPRAVESLDLSGFDLVVSSSHCVAKGVRPPPGVPHLCYCHTPMRYVWDQYDAYFGPGRASTPVRAAMAMLAPRLRAWDVRTAARVTRFVANSHHVRRRIAETYGRDASVVHPPVDVAAFAPRSRRGDHYVVLGAPAPYKRLDLAVEAFRGLDRPLWVIGDGVGAGAGLPGRRGAPPNVRFLGRLARSDVAEALGTARGLVLPGVEDFGIGVVEALASGTPVVALGSGGVLDTVRPPEDAGPGAPPTGVFFHRATPDALADAVQRREAMTFDAAALAASARRFAPDRFRAGLRREVEAVLEGRDTGGFP
ncbi:MAG: putative glycosyl transferase [Gemmatimonadota bacterium]